MLTTPILRFLLVLFGLLCLASMAAATTLQAKVVEVESGNTIIVSSINRSLRVKLKAVVPPESGQPFNETARDHLKALVLDKVVAIDYTHLADGYLSAKVICDGVDIGSEMLRDGFAWYDSASDHGLREGDRQLYAQNEQAARFDKRGLWQDLTPVAPWEFRRMQLARLNSISSESSFRQSQARKQRASRSLSNDDLIGAMTGGGPSVGQPNFRRISDVGTPGHWTRYESVLEHFSILFPSDGLEANYLMPDNSGNSVPIHYLAGRDERAVYLVMSTRTPNGKNAEASANDETVKGFVAGLNHSFERGGSNIIVTIKPLRYLKLNGYTGRQYALRGEGFSGVVRIYSRQVTNQRDFFMLCVMTPPGNESTADQFLNSFKIDE